MASSNKKTLRLRLRQLPRKLLPRSWVLRANLRRCDRIYTPLIAQAKGEKREHLITERMEDRASLQEQLEGIQTGRLLRRAWRYYIVAPEMPVFSEDQQDENWTRGWATDT
jgi:hypothetical protein